MKPWEKYAAATQSAQPSQSAGPWAKYAAPEAEEPAPTIATAIVPRTVADDMGTSERFWAGMGQGMSSVALGAEQLLANNPLLAAFVSSPYAATSLLNPEIAQNINREVDDRARRDAPLLDSTAGKLGGIAGQFVATAPAGAAGGAASGAGWLGKTIAAMRSGAIGGGAAGALTPVEDANNGDFELQKMLQVAEGAGSGAAVGGVLNRTGALLERMLPSNAMATVLNAFNSRANKGPLAQEGERLARATGVELTPAQVSGSRSMTMAENASRQSIFSREIAETGDRKRVAQLADYFDKTLDNLTKNASSPAAAGARVQEATKATITKLEDIRAKRAAADYGAIRDLTKGQAAIHPKSTNDLLRSILSENEGVGTPGGDALANFARKQLANVAPSAEVEAARIGASIAGNEVAGLAQKAAGLTAPAQGNLDKLMQLRSYLSKVAGGQAKISGENQDRRLATQLLRTIDDDIESAAEQVGGDLGGMLKRANASYREMSQQIDSVKASPLGKVLGEDFSGALQSGEFNSIAPELVMERLSRLRPTDLSIVRGVLEKEQPEAWQVFKRGVLEQALEKAKAMPPSEGANTAILRPNVLLKEAGDRQKLRAVYSEPELREIENALDVARRLSDRTGYNFSGTAAQGELLQLANSFRNLSAKAAASTAGAALGMRSIARLMNDNAGRAALIKIRTLPPASKRARQLAAQVSAILATDEQSEPGKD